MEDSKGFWAFTAVRCKSAFGRYRRKIAWAHLGKFSVFLANCVKTLSPAILILSNPRSGSSWVGETLGNASNACYLREPITQSYLSLDAGGFIREIDQKNPDNLYKRLSDFTFMGLPFFPEAPGVVRYPSQWRLRQRPYRRIVIKEVNPLACDFFLQSYQPRIIFLVRHPAATAISHRKLGWWKEIGENEGKKLAVRLNTAFKVLKNYNDSIIVRYEDLCLDPARIFRKLFDFARLEWDERVAAFISDKTSGGDIGNPDSTSRDSQNMIWAWKGKLTQKEMSDLRRGYNTFDLPWYQSNEDW